MKTLFFAISTTLLTLLATPAMAQEAVVDVSAPVGLAVFAALAVLMAPRKKKN